MMKFRRIRAPFFRAIAFLLLAALVLALLFYPRATASGRTLPRLVSIWNVDTFEGGKGSRTAFLKRVAASLQKKRTGAVFLVTDYTIEGAREALASGNLPDAVSFGIGLSDFAEYSLALPVSFAGGQVQSNCLAYPWCAGKYYLFSLDGSFGAAGETAISCGGENLSVVCARLEGIEGTETDAMQAYTGFLKGQYRRLLGTQRDLNRFLARGTAVEFRELSEYCDLYQYFSVLSAEKREDCLAFLEALTSKETREALSSLGMYPPLENGAKRTVSVFSSEDALKELRSAARQDGEGKNLVKFLKNI